MHGQENEQQEQTRRAREVAERPRERECHRYAENHEWVRREPDGGVRVGITDYAQDALGDIVYVDLPEVGGSVTKHLLMLGPGDTI